MKVLGMAAVALVFAACASSGQPNVKVSDADYGRLSPAQMRSVDAARQEVARAGDDVARAQLRLQEASNETERAKVDRSVADAAKKQAEAQTRIANESKNPGALEKAQATHDDAELQERVAQAHGEYADRLTDARKSQLASAQRRLEVAELKVDQAKLTALQQAGIPAAKKYDPYQMKKNIDDASQVARQANSDARFKLQDATLAEQRWQGLNEKLQASRGPAGKG